MNQEEIERIIPHRHPMLLLDEIISKSEKSLVARKTFCADEFFLQGHFPNSPIVPGVIQCECCLQAGAVLLAGMADIDDTATVPVATRMDGVKFKRMVRPGDSVEIEITLKEQVSQAFYMTGKMTVGGKLAARLDFTCSLANPEATQ